MSFVFPTNASQVQAFAGALYGIQVGTTTMAQVNADIAANGGLASTLNSYYSATFGGVATSTVAATVAANLGLTGDALASGAAYVEAQLNAAAAGARGAVISSIVNLFGTLSADATFGAAATAWNAKVAVAAAYTGAANVAVGTEVVTNGVFALTAGVDTFTGGAGNDTINGNPGASNANTFTALDNIDGGAGTDTLNVTEIGAAGVGTYTLNAAATVKNVEVLNYTVSSDNVGDTLTADVQGWSGLQTATFAIAGTDAAMNIDTKSNVTSATLVGGDADVDTGTGVDITDNGTAATTADTLASVTLTSMTDSDLTTANAVTINSDALTSLKISSSAVGATITAAAGTRALALTLDGVTGGTVADAEATTLNVSSSGTKTTAVTLNAAKATTVTVDAAVATTITDVNIAAATSLTVKGAGATTVSALSTVTALTSVDASASTGGLTLGAAIGTGVTFTGGAGKDSVIVGATTKSITTAGGDDTVTVAAVAALGTGGSIDAGEGTDTLKFSTYANAVTASAGTTFEGTVAGFERLELSGVNAAAGAAVNLANLDDINHVTLSATNTETTTISNFTSGGTLVVKADQTATKDATVAITNANTSTSDVFNIELSKATALATVEIIANDIETINVVSKETATTLLGTVTHAAILTADKATNLTVSGNAGWTAGTLVGTKFSNIDASGVTTGLVSFTTGALDGAAVTIKGGAGANTVVATASTKVVTYTGQDKVDTITVNNALDNIVNTAGGDDIIAVGTGANVVNAGAGADQITVGAGLSVITGGAGVDTLIIGARSTNGNVYATFADATVGDKIDLTALTTVASTNGALGAKVSLAGTASFLDYLNAAASTVIADAGASLVKWFQYAGDTYIVVDDTTAADAPDDSNSFKIGEDSVVKLAGLIDLSTSTTATDVLTIVAV